MQQENHTPTPDAERSVVSKLLYAVTYPVAAVTGYFASKIRTRQFFYKNLASEHMFDDLQAKRSAEYNSVREPALKSPEAVSIKSDVVAIEAKYNEAVYDRVKKLGYKGTKDYWTALRRNQKLDVGLLFAGVAGITVGSLLTIANHQEKLAAKEHEKETGPEVQ